MTSIKKTHHIFIMAVAAVLALSSQAFSGRRKAKPTIKSGHVIEDETWSGNIRVTGDIIIPDGVTVTIKPGTVITVSFDRSDFDYEIPLSKHVKDDRCNIIVNGTLKAVGKKKSKISFGVAGEKVDESDYWGGILLKSGTGSVISNCRVENAVFGVAIIGEVRAQVERSVIENCGIGIFNAQSSEAQINTTVIRKCKTAIEASSFSAPTIEYNYIADNEWGISYAEHAAPVVRENTVTGNDVGISGYGDGEAVIELNEVEKNYVGIRCFASNSVLKDNKIVKNKIGLEYKPASAPKMIKNLLSKNTVNIKEK